MGNRPTPGVVGEAHPTTSEGREFVVCPACHCETRSATAIPVSSAPCMLTEVAALRLAVCRRWGFAALRSQRPLSRACTWLKGRLTPPPDPHRLHPCQVPRGCTHPGVKREVGEVQTFILERFQRCPRNGNRVALNHAARASARKPLCPDFGRGKAIQREDS